jgi:hypothetical protein
MHVTLVQPPSNRFDTSELAPPLGLLSIAAVLRDDDVDVTIVDLNMEGLREPEHMGPLFYDWATQRIAGTAADVIGFTSMALESHVCLELARRLRQLDPGVRIVLGGPHFSAVAGEMLQLYRWIDYVVTGEGELAMRALIRALRAGRPLSAIPNLAYLDDGLLHLERLLKPAGSLNDLPFPAYELVDLETYFRLNPYRVLDIEHARGCALRCAFCYSPTHWGQGEQARSIDRILEDVQRHYELGARHLFFVGDNFLNSKNFAVSVAAAIGAANPGITWRCYATLAQLTDEVIEALARSQCKYLFIGVDAVSDHAKQQFQKSYFRGWPGLRHTLESCIGLGMTPTCAFMVNPPASAQAIADTEAALNMAAHVYNLQCGVRLNPLTVYAQSGMASATTGDSVGYSNAKVRLLLDGHWVTEENPYAQEHPHLYPYHSTVGPAHDYDRFIEATHAGFTLLDHFPRTLMQAAHAKESLWSLLSETAARVDYSTQKKASWRAQEAEAFAEVVMQKDLPSEILDTITFEIAENRLRRGHPGVRVNVEIDGTALDIELRPHAQIKLARVPTAYETTEPVPAVVAGDERSYLLVANGPAVRYLEPSPEVGELLQLLQQAAIDANPIVAPESGIASLIEAGVVALPQKYRTPNLEALA